MASTKDLKVVSETLPDLKKIMERGILSIEFILLAVAFALALVVSIRCAVSQDCWASRSAKPFRVVLSMARQKMERAAVSKKHQ